MLDHSPNQLKLKTILPWLLLVLALSSLPYLVAWLNAPADKQFTGAIINSEDFSTFISAMRQGRAGEWLFHFTFAPEPWQPQLMHLSYILLGKWVTLAGGSLTLWFHVYRLAAAAFTLVVVLFWVRTAVPNNERLQLTTWFLVVFGGGLGWLVALFSRAVDVSAYTPDLFNPEWLLFMGLLHTPHYALGLGLEMLLFACIIRMAQGEKPWRWAILGAGVSLLSGLTFVYHIPVVGLVIGLFMLWLAWQQKGIPWRIWLPGLVVLLPSLILLLYYSTAANKDPYFAHYSQVTHIIPPPSPLAVFIGLGVLAMFAVVGVRPWLADGRSPLVPIWAVANLLILYVPLTPFMGRLVLGLIVPVATLAGYGLEKSVLPGLKQRPFYTKFARYTPTPYASLRRIFLFLVIPSTIILPFWLTNNLLLQDDFPTYLSSAEVKAADWLAANTEDDALILAAYPMGNYLARAIAGKTFVGHFHFTPDLDNKLKLVERFWRPETPPAWREALLDEWGIDYIYAGQYEAALGDTAVPLPGEIVYNRDGVIIYRVTR